MEAKALVLSVNEAGFGPVVSYVTSSSNKSDF